MSLFDDNDYSLDNETIRDYRNPFRMWYLNEKKNKRLTKWCLFLAFALCILLVAAHEIDAMTTPLPHGVTQHLTN